MRAEVCTGAGDCTVGRHIHGCYADRGNCDSPEEHGIRSQRRAGDDRFCEHCDVSKDLHYGEDDCEGAGRRADLVSGAFGGLLRG